MRHASKGSKVTWKWGHSIATGVVVDVTPDTVTIASKGKKITRNGTTDNPAVIIENESGTRILKLKSELQ